MPKHYPTSGRLPGTSYTSPASESPLTGTGRPNMFRPRAGCRNRQRTPIQSLRRRGSLCVAGDQERSHRALHDQWATDSGADGRHHTDIRQQSARSRHTGGAVFPDPARHCYERGAARQDRSRYRRRKAAAAGLDSRPLRAPLDGSC